MHNSLYIWQCVFYLNFLNNNLKEKNQQKTDVHFESSQHEPRNENKPSKFEQHFRHFSDPPPHVDEHKTFIPQNLSRFRRVAFTVADTNR